MLRNKQLTPYNNFRLPCPPLAKRGSLTHSQALALSKRARNVTALSAVFLKSSRPSLPLKKAPPLISVFSPQGRRGKPPSGARNRFALRLAGHQSPRHGCAGWDRMGKGGDSMGWVCYNGGIDY